MNTLTDCFNVIFSYNLDFIGSEETGDIVDDCGSISLVTIDILIDLLEDTSGNFYIWISSDWWCQDIYFRWYREKEDFDKWMNKVLYVNSIEIEECRFLEDFIEFAESITSYKSRRNRIVDLYKLK